MNKFKQLWKIRRFKRWLIIALSVIVLFLTVTIVANQFSTLIDTILGGQRKIVVSGDPSGYNYYTSEYASKEDAYEAGNDLNELLNEEGIVLLKNDDDVLPLGVGTNISVFGKNSVNLVYGGTGSGGGSFEGAATLYESLDDAGFNVNPTLKAFYESDDSGDGRPSNPPIEGGVLNGFATGETPIDSYTSAIRDSYDDYDDAALVVISRIGGEGFDLPRTMLAVGGAPIEGAASADDHYLELDQNEQDLLEEVCDNFDKVILIINSGTSMELGFLDDNDDFDDTQNDYDYADGIQGALWIGGPGFSGIMALGRVLNGEVNPSGRTVDTYTRDFSADPTWANFSNNLVSSGNRYTMDGRLKPYFFVDYEEGIYVGYRYYETRGYTDGETWYDNNVVYPLGYGLSYTTFDWEIKDTTPNDGREIDQDEEIEVEIEVTNTGDVAGKDVVQLYVTAPYYEDGIEKAHKVLVGFAKTAILEPGESQRVTISFSAYDFASYDWNDANDNGFSGYELDEGTYTFSVSQNAHDAVETFTYTVPVNGYQFATDPDTDYTVENRFQSTSEHLTTILSRSDWDGTFPSTPTAADREIDQSLIDALESRSTSTPTASVIPTQSDAVLSEDEVTVLLYELIGLDYDDPLWETFLNQFTFEQMADLIGDAAFKTLNFDALGVPLTVDADGPSGFVNFMGDPTINGTVTYATPIVVASTWNVELAESQGVMIGNEAIWGDQTREVPVLYTGWYAPAMNIHRTPFSGRNNEYYSEDGVLSGQIAAAVINGVSSKGVVTYIKHFAVNDQETNRDLNGLITWADEQSMRELYFKPFEISVKDGGSMGIMSAFNRIGTEWVGGDYDLLTEVLRNEWGFEGAVITDFNLQTYMDTTQMVMAGGDLNLSTTKGLNSDDYDDPTFATAVRNATHNIMYVVANSNAMNGYGADVVYRWGMAPWQLVLYWGDVAILQGMATWGFFVTKNSLKKIKPKAAV